MIKLIFSVVMLFGAYAESPRSWKKSKVASKHVIHLEAMSKLMKICNITLFAIVLFINTVALGSVSNNCSKYRKQIDTFLLKEDKKMRIQTEKDLYAESLEDFKAEKDRDEPGCVCAKLDGENTSCGLILIPKAAKFSPSVYIIKLEPKPVVLIKVEDFPLYNGNKSSFYLLPKKKAVIENYDPGAKEKVTMSHDGIEFVNPGKSAFTIFIKNSKLQHIWTSD